LSLAGWDKGPGGFKGVPKQEGNSLDWGPGALAYASALRIAATVVTLCTCAG
jgi:hypothetical protein